MGLRFRALGFKILGFRVQGLGFRVHRVGGFGGGQDIHRCFPFLSEDSSVSPLGVLEPVLVL